MDRTQKVFCQTRPNQTLGNLLGSWVRADICSSVLTICLIMVSAGLAISHPGAPGQSVAQPEPPVPTRAVAAQDLVTPMPLAVRIRRHVVPTHGMCSILPAHRPVDGLLSGNGKMYVEVYGDPLSEHVVFHEERLVKPWVGKPLEAPRIADVLPEVRKLILQGKYREGLEMSLNAAADTDTPPGTENLPEHPAFDMRIQMREERAVTDYLRTIDFESGEVKVQWRDKHGDWDRRTFVSRPDNAVVQILGAPQGHPLELRIRLDTSPVVEDRGWPHNSGLKRFYDPEVRFNRDFNGQRLILTGHYIMDEGNDGYASVTRVVPEGGTVRIEDGALTVQGARSLLLITRIEWFKDLDPDKVKSLAAAVDELTPDYGQLLARHRKVQSEVIDRASVDFGGSDQHALSAEEMLIDQKTRTGLSPALMENLFDMGRYWLFLRSGDFPPMWGHININVNLQISGANAGDLPEAMDSFARWVEGLLPDSRTNARNIFGARGALFSIHPTPREGALIHFDYGWPHHYWVAGGGWLYSPLWDRYLITGDRDYLRTHVLPGLKELALFYEDYLQQTDERGNYIFVPSYSPENWPDNADGAPAVINANMDIMVCREVLTHLIQASEILGVESENVPKWKETLAKMPPYLLDTDGALKEWAWPSLEERLDHRHVSHLYGVWPGDEIDPDRTPQLAKAAWLADRTRGQENASAHGLFHRALAAARLKDAYLVNFNLKQVLEQGYINTSLTTMHNPHRMPAPDAQGALPTLMMEMLVYSRPGVIELLPALPDSLSKGSIKGVMCRTEVEVESLVWETTSHSVDLTLRSRKPQDLDLIVRYGIESATGPAGVIVDAPKPDATHCRLRLPAGEPVVLHIRIGTHKPADWVKTVASAAGQSKTTMFPSSCCGENSMGDMHALREESGELHWPSNPPPDCPFAKSDEISGVVFTGRHREYENADTWFPSWASDGKLYSPYADGSVGGVEASSKGPHPTTGQAVIIGDDPLNLTVKSLGVHSDPATPYIGRYPIGTLVRDGVWYYGTMATEDGIGPVVGFRASTDFGKTWTDPNLTPLNNLFKEGGTVDAKIKMGIPHFVDFGQNMQHSPDGKAYLVAHGATRPWVYENWISGDQIYLARVLPSARSINDRSKYEFFSGSSATGEAIWTRDFAMIKPLLEWNDHTGLVTITYDAPLKRYLMCVTHGPWPGLGPNDTYILVSDRITGSWKLVTYLRAFGEEGYFVNLPSKFISKDGYTAWMCYSESEPPTRPIRPAGGRYGMCLQEIKLLKAEGDPKGP